MGAIKMQLIVRNQFPKFYTVGLAMGGINYILNLISLKQQYIR